MSGGGGSQTTTQKSDPWAGQQPYLRDVFARAQAQASKPAPTYFPGSTVAAPGAETTEAQNYALNLARNGLSQVGNAGVNAATFNLGAGRDVSTNPYLQSAIQAAVNPMVQNFTGPGGMLSQIRSTGVENAGGGQSTREGIAQGVALRGFNQQVGDVASNIAYQGYQNAQENAMRTMALMPQIQQGALQPAQTIAGVGQARDNYQQMLIDDAMQRYFFNQQAPQTQLQQYAQLIQGGYGGTTITTAPGTKSNPLMGGLGGAATGAYIGSVVPGVGTAVGAGVGGLLGLMGGM